MKEDCVYRFVGVNGQEGKARPQAEPCPLYPAGRGARVARQRGPILRAGPETICDSTVADKTHRSLVRT